MVFLLCGMTGSGKTTYARKLEEERGAVRLSLDEWMIRLFGHHMPREVFDERIRSCQAIMLDLTEQLVARGVDVVLDWGFWSREHRMRTVERLRAVGADPILVHFDTALDIIRQRLRARNASLPEGTFEITEDMLDDFCKRFEPPGEDESPRRMHAARHR
jgi:predicted kinase